MFHLPSSGSKVSQKTFSPQELYYKIFTMYRFGNANILNHSGQAIIQTALFVHLGLPSLESDSLGLNVNSTPGCMTQVTYTATLCFSLLICGVG